MAVFHFRTCENKLATFLRNTGFMLRSRTLELCIGVFIHNMNVQYGIVTLTSGQLSAHRGYNMERGDKPHSLFVSN